MTWMAIGIGAGLVLLLCAASLGAWAVYGDRSRGRRRCRRCWYDLRDTQGLPVTCPECGRAHRTERSLQRTRRRWRAAAGALALAACGVAVGMTPLYRSGQLMTVLPAPVLAELVPLYPPTSSMLAPAGSMFVNHPGVEIVRRVSGVSPLDADGFSALGFDEMDPALFAAVIGRLADGGALAEPGSERWVETSNDLLSMLGMCPCPVHSSIQRYASGTPADDALRAAMEKYERVMPPTRFRTRTVWPSWVGVTVQTGLIRPEWTPDRYTYRLEADWAVRGTDITGSHTGTIDAFLVPAVGDAGDEVTLDVKSRLLRITGHGANAVVEVVREETATLRWRVVERVEDAVEVVEDPLIDEAMMVVFAAECAMKLERPVDGSVWLDLRLDGVAFGVEVELFDGDQRLAWSAHRWLARDGALVHRTITDLSQLSVRWYEERIRSALARDTLRVRVRSDPMLALGVVEADRVWMGELEVLVSEARAAAAGSGLPDVKPEG